MRVDKFNIAIVGVTGAVGEAMLRVLEEQNFPVNNLYPLASKRSLGNTVLFKNRPYDIIALEDFDFDGVDIALFSAGGEISKKYAAIAVSAGAVVIDNTSTFRYDPEIPLIVPEVNPQDLVLYEKHGIIANPNCSTIQMLVAIKPIYDAVGISRINVATYQAVSGSGRKGISELVEQLGEYLNGRASAPKFYSRPIAFNAIPHIDEFQDNGYTREEMKMVWETQKILHDKDIMVNPTAVRVPVLYGHSEAIYLELKNPLSAQEARTLLNNAPGVKVIDDPQKLAYPTALTDAAGNDSVFVGRIRQDLVNPLGLNLWVVADNVRKGAATNAVQIAKLFCENF